MKCINKEQSNTNQAYKTWVIPWDKNLLSGQYTNENKCKERKYLTAGVEDI